MSRTSLLLLLTISACANPSVSLVEQGGESSRIEISGVSRDSLTPPFPATRRIEVDLPTAGFLRFSPALVTEQSVRRARVSFRIDVEANGETSVVYQELFRFGDANRWHDREIDLSRWAGERVVLVFVTRTPEERTDILWADRVRAVWGEPVIVSSRGRQVARIADDLVGETEEWLLDQLEPAGVAPDDLSGLVLDLILAGILGLVIRELYLRFAIMGSNHDAFGNLFPLFSLTTVLVIMVVQSSLALSLGLIGALSIVRFRTTIKTPEEITYLLFCISVGVALGAQQRLMAIASVVFISLFVVARHRRSKDFANNYLLTISGDAGSFFDGEAGSVLERVRPMVRELQMQRLDHAGKRVELRAVVTVDGKDGVTGLAASLRKSLPALQFSFVEADDIL